MYYAARENQIYGLPSLLSDGFWGKRHKMRVATSKTSSYSLKNGTGVGNEGIHGQSGFARQAFDLIAVLQREVATH